METVCLSVENNAIRKMMSIRHVFPDDGKYINLMVDEKIKNCLTKKI